VIVNKLVKRYGDRAVLDGLSLTIDNRERVCLMGPSGVGKTTLMRILLGLEKAEEGTITDLPERFSVAFQDETLCDVMSAVKNVALVAAKGVKKEDIERTLLAVGLEKEQLYAPVETFSGGMKRRVSVVRALLAESDFVCLDEPFKGLDEQVKAKTVEAVMQYTKDRGLLCITHDEEDAAALSARTIRLT